MAVFSDTAFNTVVAFLTVIALILIEASLAYDAHPFPVAAIFNTVIVLAAATQSIICQEAGFSALRA
jgi:hypothetical protein